MQVGFVHLNSIKQIHRNEDTTSMQSASSFLNDSDHKNNNTFFFFLGKPLKAEGEQSMQHCTHLHSMFYPACLVECYTDSIYRGKNRKGQISRKRTFRGIFSGRGSDVFTTVTLTWLPVRLGQLGQAIARIQAQRPADLLAAEKPKVHGLQLECSFLLSVALRSSCRHMVALPDSPRAAPVQPH